MGPRKPPRCFTVDPLPPAATQQRRHTDSDLPLLRSPLAPSPSPLPCRCCCEVASPIQSVNVDDDRAATGDNLVLQGGALRRWETTNCHLLLDEDDSDTNQAPVDDFVASHPLCRRSPPRATGRRKATVDGLVSPTRHPEMGARTSLRTPVRRRHVASTCHVHGHPPHHHHHHHHSQTSPAKPAKSILVRRRQRGRVKLQSLSDVDADGSECCAEVPDDALPSPPPSRVARPVSLPDATVLYAGLTDLARAGDAGDELDHSRDCTPAVDLDDYDGENGDGEQFRAKKSVSFSEKIFYHSMPSVSPLESPLCPPLRLPVAPPPPPTPECRFTVPTALQSESESLTHGMISLIS